MMEAAKAIVAATIIDEVNRLIGARNFQELDVWLRKVPVYEADPVELIALARSAAPVRSKLPSWTQFVRDCSAAIDAHGGDGKRVLNGLLG